MSTTIETEKGAPMRHPATMPLTLHEWEVAARLLACGWGIATTARALQCHREATHCYHAA